jgi:hypothetical protein
MSNSTWTTRIGLVLATGVMIGSCAPVDDRSFTADTGKDTPALSESHGALATRHEAQESMDRARLAFQRKYFDLAESELSSAAAFMRTEAQEVAGEHRETLRRAADVLDVVAARVSRGQIRDLAAFDRASLDVNTAEATFHLLRSKDAIAARDNVRAGEELIMCVDHLERAASDARRQNDPAVQVVIADVRTLAREMVKGVGLVPDEVTNMSEAVESVIARVRAATPRVAGPVEANALAARHEAQESFDRARAALLRRDFAASARALSAAAAFISAHADEAELGAIAALQGTAKELELLAKRLAAGEAQTPRNFDRVVANANRAEAQHHLTRAEAAMGKREYRVAGEEILMSVDHLERVALDLGKRRADQDAAALIDARELAARMVRGVVPARADSRRVIEQLEAELRRVCGLIDLEARACAIAPTGSSTP